MAFDSNDGVSRLAAALDSRMKQHADKPLCLDFAEIQADCSLLSNTFPIAIPKQPVSRPDEDRSNLPYDR